MKVSNKSYPYPVIGNENDVEGRFVVVSFVRNVTPDMYFLEYEFQVTNKTLLDLLAKSEAQIIMQVECSTTFYRHAFTSTELKGTLEIPTGSLREKVIVRFYICAAEDIADYLPVGSHPDYAGASFDIEKGDVLAEGGYTSFIAEKTFDPLKSPVDSLIRVKPGKNKGSALAEFDQDKIVIILPEDDYLQYLETRGRKLNDNIHATLAFPVLIEALNLMRKEDTEFAECAWYIRVNQILIDLNIDIGEPYVAAQKILSNPIARNFRQTNETIAGMELQD